MWYSFKTGLLGTLKKSLYPIRSALIRGTYIPLVMSKLGPKRLFIMKPSIYKSKVVSQRQWRRPSTEGKQNGLVFSLG